MTKLPRQAGYKEQRWAQLLAGDVEVAEEPAAEPRRRRSADCALEQRSASSSQPSRLQDVERNTSGRVRRPFRRNCSSRRPSRCADYLRCRVAFVEQAKMDSEPGNGGADDRRHPEEPQLLERPSADDDRGSGAARRVHREIGDGYTDQVNQREAEADRDGRKALPGARRSVAPRMIMRNMNVSTISAIRHASME